MAYEEDFAGLLRRFRERLSPETAGIPVPDSGRRRAGGLRREELAELAGVSVDHVKRLEQRRRHPSPRVVDALARALRLGVDEHGRLCSAAGHAVPSSGRRVPREITPAARRMLERLTGVPVAVCDAAWTVLAGNDAWNSYRCGAAAGAERDRNLAWRIFTDAPTGVARSPRGLATFRASLVTDLRAARLRYDDPYLRDLIEDLHRASAEFTRLWHDVGTVPYEADLLSAVRPDGGHDDLERDTLAVDGDLRVVVFTRRGDLQVG